jgi:protein-S-isoprenylcysteine O-methyltransferase Ste14
MKLKSKLIDFLKKNKSTLLNIYIAINFLIFAVWKLYFSFKEGTLDFTLVSYTMQSTVLIFYVLIRKQHKLIDNNYFHQFIALAAFFSGILFIWQPQTGGDTENMISNIIIFTSNILGIFTIINLGKSFGILIAIREIKTKGLYSYVRHPMYGTDILLRIGFTVSHFTLFTVLLVVISILCYLYRAILEEKYLSSQDEYKLYVKKVKIRFIPYIF